MTNLIPELKRRERVIENVYVEGKPLVVEDGFESSEIAEELAREKKTTLYYGSQKLNYKENKEPCKLPKTLTKKEIIMLSTEESLKEKYGGKKLLRKKDLINMYFQIGSIYNVGQHILKSEIMSLVERIYGRALNRSHFSRHFQLCREAGVLENIDRRLVVFKGKKDDEEDVEEPVTEEIPEKELVGAIKDAALVTSLHKHRFLLHTDEANLAVEFKDLKDLMKIILLAKDIINPLARHTQLEG